MSKDEIMVTFRLPRSSAVKIDEYLKDSEIFSNRSEVLRLALKLFFERIEKENQRKRHLAEASQVLNPAAFAGVSQ